MGFSCLISRNQQLFTLNLRNENYSCLQSNYVKLFFYKKLGIKYNWVISNSMKDFIRMHKINLMSNVLILF